MGLGDAAEFDDFDQAVNWVGVRSVPVMPSWKIAVWRWLVRRIRKPTWSSTM